MLGERIASLRARLGWSQAELARRMHISPSAVGMYEQGRREPSANMLIILARVLGVSIDFLLTGKALCRSDWRAMGEISPRSEENPPAADVLKLLSRDELIVLLTASLFGSLPDLEDISVP